MRKFINAFLAVTLIAILATPSLILARPRNSQSWTNEELANVLDGLLQENPQCADNFPTANSILEVIKGSNEGTGLRALISYGIAVCAYRNDKYQIVLDNLSEAIKFEEGKKEILFSGLISALQIDRYDNAVSIFRQMRAAAGKPLDTFSARLWWAVINASEKSSNPTVNRIYMHRELVATNYLGVGSASEPFFRFDYLKTLLETDGDKAIISSILTSITSPENAAVLLVNKNYDMIRSLPEFTYISDLNSLVQKDEEKWKAIYDANPKSIEVVIAYSNALRNAQKYTAALELINSALQKAQAEPNYYSDIGDQKNWLLNEKTYVLFGLNRLDEAFGSLEAAIGSGESGGYNISQVINLAIYQLDANRFQDSLRTIAKVGAERTRYADGLIASVKACANFKLGNGPNDYETASLTLKSLGEDSLESLLETQICFGKLDEASETLIKMLDTPNFSAAALLKISACQNPRPFESDFQKEKRTKYLQISNMPKVQEAINRHGRIINLPFDVRRYI